MGGIKNKLKQLSDKVANLVFSARLGSSVRRSLLDGVDNKTFNLASTARGGGLRSKPVGLLSITKHASIACFTLALISTIGLNLYKTYSNSSIETSAIGSSNNGEPAIQADIDPTSISLSITSSPSSSTGGNNSNLSLSIPQGGGIATGRHTVTVSTGSSVIGYELTLSSNDNNETGLVNSEDINADANTIPTTTGTITNPSQLADKTYGYTLSNIDSSNGGNSNLVNTNIWLGLQPKSSPATITTVDDTDNILTIGQPNEATHNIYYGVNIQNPVETRAGDYTRQVVYTVVGELMPEPVVDSITPNKYALGSGDGLDEYGRLHITIKGKDLDSAREFMLSGGNPDGDGIDIPVPCTVISSNELSCILTPPEKYSISDIGPYDLTLITDYNEVVFPDAFEYTARSVCKNGSDASVCRVDTDDNLIPVAYDEDNDWWRIVTNEEMQGNPGSWYDYGYGEWANAITLRDDFNAGQFCVRDDQVAYGSSDSICFDTRYTPLEMAKAVQNGKYSADRIAELMYHGDGNNRGAKASDAILGYWVYIPRYAYQVMRRDASNGAVSAQNFNIVFETKDNPVKQPVECSAGNYQSCVENQYGESGLTYPNTTSQSDPLNSKTAWATHPAFTWMDADGNPVELNGIWVGKFETTGSTEEPTVLPNQKHMSQSSGNIGDMYDVAKSIGVEDKNNVYGNSAQTSYNNGKGYHNLAISTSHMLKNSEWGAVAYLSASRYGAGVNNVQINANASSGNDGNDDSSYGVTGCGPNGSSQYNTENGQLASTTNNIYGVYDMAGGAYEYVMGSYTNDSTQSYPSNGYITNKVKPPYVDLYVNPPFNGNEGTNNNLCTWTTCGGHALFETAGWGDDYSYFVHSSNPWFLRGGYANADSAGTGVFYSGVSNGRTFGSNSFRVGLAALSAM